MRRSSEGCSKPSSKLVVNIGELLSESRSSYVAAVEGHQELKKSKSSHSNERFPYFCSLENFESAVVYLSQELQALGLGNLNLQTTGEITCDGQDLVGAAFSSTGSVHRGSLLQIDLICLINRCWEVVQLHRSLVQDSCALQEQHRRDATANAKLQTNVSELQMCKVECDRKVQEAVEKRRQVLAENSDLLETNKQQKDEIRRLSSLLQQRDSQYRHDLRKKELEGDVIKQRLVQLVAGPGIVERRLDQSAPLAANEDRQSSLQRPKWNIAQQENPRHRLEVYRKVVCQYEVWLAELKCERDVLYKALDTTHTTLMALVKKHAKVMTPEDMAASLTDSVYSTDSLDEPLNSLTTTPQCSSSTSSTSPAVDAMHRQITESLLSISVILAERTSGDIREARIKRINELTASAHLYADTYTNDNTNTLAPSTATGAHKHQQLFSSRDANTIDLLHRNNSSNIINDNRSSNSNGSDGGCLNIINPSIKLQNNGNSVNTPTLTAAGNSNTIVAGSSNAAVCHTNTAILQLAKHLGILATTHNTPDAKFASPTTESNKAGMEERTGTPALTCPEVKPCSTSTPEMLPPITPTLPPPHITTTPDILLNSDTTPDIQSAGGVLCRLDPGSNKNNNISDIDGCHPLLSNNRDNIEGRQLHPGDTTNKASNNNQNNDANDNNISNQTICTPEIPSNNNNNGSSNNGTTHQQHQPQNSNTISQQNNTSSRSQHNLTDQSWIHRTGGPDDSTATEVMTLKKLLEEERDTVKREKDSYAQAVLRLNRERAAFEQDKVNLLRQQFLDEVPDAAQTHQRAGEDAASPDAGCGQVPQASCVPAWLSDHHCRPFSPPSSQHLHHRGNSGDTAHRLGMGSPSRLVSVPTITPPPPPITEPHHHHHHHRSRPLVLGPRRKNSRDDSGGSADSSSRTRLSGHSRVSASTVSSRRCTPSSTRASSMSRRSSGDGSSMLSLASAPSDCDKYTCHISRGSDASECSSSVVTTLGKQSSRRSPSLTTAKTRISLMREPLAKNNTSAVSYKNSNGNKNSSRDASVNDIKSRESSGTRTKVSSRESSVSKDSGFSKNTTTSRDSSSSRYLSLPRSSKLSNLSVRVKENFSDVEDKSGINLLSSIEGRDSIVPRGCLTSRQGAETPPSRYASSRKTGTVRPCLSYASNSLPRQLGGKSNQHLINSITDASTERKILESMRSARTLDGRHGSSSASGRISDYRDFDISTVSGLLAATRHSLTAGGEAKKRDSDHSEQSSHRPMSDSFTQAVDINDMYASLPIDFVSRLETNEVFNKREDIPFPLSGDPKDCVGDCKKILNVTLHSSCLCHLLKRKAVDFENSPTSSDSATGTEEFISDDCRSEQLGSSVSVADTHRDRETNARINALETSLKNLLSAMSGGQKQVDSTDSGIGLRTGSDGGEGYNKQSERSCMSEFSFLDNISLKEDGLSKANHRYGNERHEKTSLMPSCDNRSKLQIDAQKRLSAGILELQQSGSHQHFPSDFVTSMTSKHRNIGHYNTKTAVEYPQSTISAHDSSQYPVIGKSSANRRNDRMSTEGLSLVDDDSPAFGGIFTVPKVPKAINNDIGSGVAPVLSRSVTDLSELSSLDSSQFEPSAASSTKSGGTRKLSVYRGSRSNHFNREARNSCNDSL